MDNPPSAQQLELPEVPDNFNGGVGVDFARALMALLAGAKVTSEGGPNQADITTLQTSMEGLTTSVENNIRNQQRVVVDGATDSDVTVAFQGWGDTNYEVTWNILVPPATNPGFMMIALVAGSKQANQFQVRMDGAIASYSVEFVITQIRTTGI